MVKMVNANPQFGDLGDSLKREAVERAHYGYLLLAIWTWWHACRTQLPPCLGISSSRTAAPGLGQAERF